MLGINHTTTGIIIALTVKQPALAMPLALASHFALDAIPHHGNDMRFIRGKRTYNQKVILDGLSSILILLVALMLQPHSASIIAACAFLAILPDLIWPLALYTKHSGILWEFFKFHKGIQRSETPEGIRIEIIWATFSGFLLASLLR